MLRAPVRLPVQLPVQLPVSMLALGLLLVVAGCGSSGGAKSQVDQPSKAATACRQDWKGLATKVGGRDDLTYPSALAARWNNVSATIDYYATSASGQDCDTRLADQRKAMDALQAFGARLARFDVEKRFADVQTDAQLYAAGARPAAPKAGKATKGKKAKKPVRPPRPTDVGAAVKALAQQAPLATKQQDAGWEQAHVADLDDAAAVRKTVKDLAFLSSESHAYRVCAADLALITQALKAKTS